MDSHRFLIKAALVSALYAMIERPLSRPVFPIPSVHTPEKQQIIDELFNSLPLHSQMPSLRRRLAQIKVPHA